MQAIIVESKLPTIPSRAEEVASMARSIGYKIVDTVIQQRKSVHHTYTIGPGKLDEVKQLVKEKKAAALIFANSLPGSQVFKVQKVLGGSDIKVIDRNLLILEVFDHRAMTKEAKLQIQLARLRYTFSWGKEYLRLKGILGEQVGWSGPGDYPYSDYERGARRQISRLEKELKQVLQKKKALRDRRRELGFPIVALAGYTQSGKTTFFNRVVSEKKNTGLGPFTTLTTFARRVDVQGPVNFSFMLIDSIGFIEDMHPIIVRAFNTTLDEIAKSDLILLFVDASEDPESVFRKLTASSYVLKRIAPEVPLVICLNKVDKCSPDQVREEKGLASRLFSGVPQVELSALKGAHTEDVLTLAYERLSSELAPRKEKPSRVTAPVIVDSSKP
ncbi:GTPase HflX [archaeon 13_1_20CM_2_54_9]|nr:MAG: GTPase HflX [Crenarchaeota archaeon 13_1_40CM_3_53_5]OLE74820.1 MAG: GTPase HflX [archaeon 13_1_20CM_2_54_9]TMI27416.1 MAG: GTPase HflX [Candidatus Bathyarchaeota archaeon]TMI31202.1 MAG: GTPase HflX [Candidatus Bathyarchaeota archaeon]